MIACIQRVSRASVTTEGALHSKIEKGMLILLGVAKGDTESDCDYLAKKCAEIRIFDDENGKMNKSCEDVGGKILVVTNFTLCGNCKKGRRPSFDGSEIPKRAKDLSERFISQCASYGVEVLGGVFGAHMEVALINDGPVTLILDTETMLAKQTQTST